MKKIFFLASISKDKDTIQKYKQVVSLLEGQNYKVLADYLLKDDPGKDDAESDSDSVEFYKQFTKKLKQVDLLCAEVSDQRVSLGYYIAMALEWGKPVIVLYKKGKKSNLLKTLEENDKLYTCEYLNEDDLLNELPVLLKFSEDRQEVRFNFFITPKQQNYLDWISKTQKIPRSVYLRRLINENLEVDEDFNKVI